MVLTVFLDCGVKPGFLWGLGKVMVSLLKQDFDEYS